MKINFILLKLTAKSLVLKLKAIVKVCKIHIQVIFSKKNFPSCYSLKNNLIKFLVISLLRILLKHLKILSSNPQYNDKPLGIFLTKLK